MDTAVSWNWHLLHCRSDGCQLTYWVTHICVGKRTIIGSDNGLSPDRRQAIIWTNAWMLLIASLGTNFSEILNGIQTISFTKMHLKMSSAKWRPFCLGLNVLNNGFGEKLSSSIDSDRKGGDHGFDENEAMRVTLYVCYTRIILHDIFKVKYQMAVNVNRLELK